MAYMPAEGDSPYTPPGWGNAADPRVALLAKLIQSQLLPGRQGGNFGGGLRAAYAQRPMPGSGIRSAYGGNPDPGMMKEIAPPGMDVGPPDPWMPQPTDVGPPDPWMPAPHQTDPNLVPLPNPRPNGDPHAQSKAHHALANQLFAQQLSQFLTRGRNSAVGPRPSYFRGKATPPQAHNQGHDIGYGGNDRAWRR